MSQSISNNVSVIRLTQAAIAFLISITAGTADEPVAGPSAAIPELKLLEGFAGKWTGEFAAKNSQDKIKLASEATWVMEGTYLMTKGVSKPSNGENSQSSMILWTYDGQKKVYRRWIFFSGGGSLQETGHWAADSKTFFFEGRDPDTGASTASTVKVTDNDTREWTLRFKNIAGDVVAEVSGVNRRVK